MSVVGSFLGLVDLHAQGAHRLDGAPAILARAKIVHARRPRCSGLANITARWLKCSCRPARVISASMSGARRTFNSDGVSFSRTFFKVLRQRKAMILRSGGGRLCAVFASGRKAEFGGRPDSPPLVRARRMQPVNQAAGAAYVTGLRLRLKISVHKSGDPAASRVMSRQPGPAHSLAAVVRQPPPATAASRCGRWLTTRHGFVVRLRGKSIRRTRAPSRSPEIILCFSKRSRRRCGFRRAA